ncbi:TPA: AraC family transcriptional regulator, partial [Clostridioides difficile]|nr:AraC family transcriptional regulator [Clostridioides difficile]
IIENVGYENLTYFYKIFKNKYGITPKEYKKNIKNGQ